MKSIVKKMGLTALIAALLMMASAALAEETYAAQEAAAKAAVQAAMPEAAVDFAVRERDDGRDVWEVFFRKDGMLGQARVIEGTNEVRHVEMFNQSGASSLTASEIIARLKQEKGALSVIELELDWDDGELVYEGEVELDGRRYDFEMSDEGRLIEWERD